jgi:L-alanine-DL-glutamate epimerase-like enolase superfamily enzyme
MPHADLVEFIGGSAYVDGILAEPFQLDADGYLHIPHGAGLGVALDPAKASRYSPRAAALFSG